MKRLVDGDGDAIYNASILRSYVEVPVAKTVQVEFRRLLAEKEVRENRRITQVEVASATGLSRQTLGPWLDGSIQFIRLDTLASMCVFLDCAPGDLLVLADAAVGEGLALE